MEGGFDLGPEAGLERVDLSRLRGWGGVPCLPARRAFHLSCVAFADGRAPLRPARYMPEPWRAVFAQAAAAAPSGEDEARRFFLEQFCAFRVKTAEGGLFTGYYEPEAEARLRPSAEFSEPIRGRPADLVTFAPGEAPLGPGLEAGRRRPDGGLEPYPTRREIEDGDAESGPVLVWVKDAAAAFEIHVQGCARVTLEDGARLRLTYAGRNGRPYGSIGKRLAADGVWRKAAPTSEHIWAWARAQGLGPGQTGRRMLQTNDSYIFFELSADAPGPIGGAGVALTEMSSMAVDRRLWPYGLPYWIEGDGRGAGSAAASPFERVLIGQDTGSAIVGPARGDVFFGSGAGVAGAASRLRHRGELVVLLPRLAAGAS